MVIELVPNALPIVPVKVHATDTLNSELKVVKVAFEKSPAKIVSLAFVSLIITFALSADPVNVIPSFVREFLREWVNVPPDKVPLKVKVLVLDIVVVIVLEEALWGNFPVKVMARGEFLEVNYNEDIPEPDLNYLNECRTRNLKLYENINSNNLQ